MWVIRDSAKRMAIFYCKDGDVAAFFVQEGFELTMFVDRTRKEFPTVLIALNKKKKLEDMLQITAESKMEKVDAAFKRKYIEETTQVEEALQKSFDEFLPALEAK